MSDLLKSKAAAWPSKPLGEVFRINGDQVVPMASPTAEFVHYSIPAWDATGGAAIELGVLIESNKTAITKPSVLVSKLNPRKPRVVAVPSPAERTCCSTEFICYQPKQSNEELSFWADYFASADFSARLARVAVGSTNSHTRAAPKETLKWFVPEVPPTEQKKIAQVFDTVDTAIHATKAIIAKLKAVKQGLLHDLLTRGIDTNGELRPPQTEAPHLYKESPLGWIPKEWDAVRVGEDADIEHGFAFPGHQFTDKEVGPVLLVPGNFHREGGLYFTPENTKYFSGKYPQQYVLAYGDVLIVMTDLSPMTLILGRTVVLDEEFKVLHNQRIGKFRFRKDGLWDAAFFAETLSQDAVRLKVIAEATGTTVRHTSPDRIKSCYVARPRLQEQQFAAQRIAVLDLRRKREETNFLKLKQTKSGLMDDLLTGRVRVTPLLAEAAQQQGSA